MSNDGMWEQENKELRKELGDTQVRANHLESECEQLRADNQALQELRDSAMKLYGKANERIEELKAAWEAEAKANGELERRIEELEREFDFWHSVALDYKRDLGEYMRRGPDSLTWEPISHEQIDAAWASATAHNQDGPMAVAKRRVLSILGIVRCPSGHGWVIGGEDE